MGKTHSALCPPGTFARLRPHCFFVPRRRPTRIGFCARLSPILGIPDQGDDIVRMQRRLNEVLIREVHAGRRVVVVIDEAQNLEDPVLEAVRMLSNFEIPGTKTDPDPARPANRNWQIGWPGLRVGSITLQRIFIILSRLKQFSASETADYIDHRLKVARFYEGTNRCLPHMTHWQLFILEAMVIPRNINNLCFHALSLGFSIERSEL